MDSEFLLFKPENAMINIQEATAMCRGLEEAFRNTMKYL
jgi:hypothetical protein